MLATLFVGRENELKKLGNLLHNPASRLVTLVGLAGVDKTRLAIKVARNQLDRFSQGVYFVSLTPLVSPDMIVAAIVHTNLCV